MFSRLFATVLVTFPMVALAAPTAPAQDPHHEHHDHGGQCNVGQLSCCNQIQAIPGTDNANAGGLIGVAANIPVFLGLDCNPISALIGVSGNSCAAQPVCCQQNAFPGLVNALNCAPVNVNI